MKNIKENFPIKTLIYQKLLVFSCQNLKATVNLKNNTKITGKRKLLMILSRNKMILKHFIQMSQQLQEKSMMRT